MQPKPTETTTEKIIAAAVPAHATVSHDEVLQYIQESIINQGLRVLSTNFTATNEMDVVSGIAVLQDDQNQDYVFEFMNTYRKRTNFTCSVGGFLGEMHDFVTYHGTPVPGKLKAGTDRKVHVKNLIEETLRERATILERLREEIQAFTTRDWTRRQASQIAGILFSELEIITSSQLNLLQKALKSHFLKTPATIGAMDLYDMIAGTIATEHPETKLLKLRRLHSFYMSEIDPVELKTEPEPLLFPVSQVATSVAPVEEQKVPAADPIQPAPVVGVGPVQTHTVHIPANNFTAGVVFL